MATAEQAGRRVSVMDGFLAATALTHALVTLNVRDLSILSPSTSWTHGGRSAEGGRRRRKPGLTLERLGPGAVATDAGHHSRAGQYPGGAGAKRRLAHEPAGRSLSGQLAGRELPAEPAERDGLGGVDAALRLVLELTVCGQAGRCVRAIG